MKILLSSASDKSRPENRRILFFIPQNQSGDRLPHLSGKIFFSKNPQITGGYSVKPRRKSACSQRKVRNLLQEKFTAP